MIFLINLLICLIFHSQQAFPFHSLFVLYINDLHTAIKFSKVHHFADDTNLLHKSSSIQKLNKFADFDKKNFSNWLNVNKISLNVSKAELIMF